MHRRLAAYISAGRLFGTQHRLLLAVSGGPDSVVMATLIHRLGYNMAIAHCNYKLRGADSEGDESFCREFAKKLGCSIYSKTMRLSARRSDQSLQEEARSRRYAWFDELRRKEGFDFVLTAHHADDQAETLLLHLMRGTG